MFPPADAAPVGLPELLIYNPPRHLPKAIGTFLDRAETQIAGVAQQRRSCDEPLGPADQ
jgi:hypothetical protein